MVIVQRVLGGPSNQSLSDLPSNDSFRPIPILTAA